MDQGHYSIMENMIPMDCRASIGMFLDYADDVSINNVPDPYYGSIRDFEEVFSLIERGVNGLVRHLESEDLL
jgi:protein-tyrosine phosphatase